MKQYLSDLENKNHNGFKTPEEELVSHIAKNNTYNEFINRWKENFVDTIASEQSNPPEQVELV